MLCLCPTDRSCFLFLFQRDGTPDPVPRPVDWIIHLMRWRAGSPARWPWPHWQSRRVRLTWRNVVASVGTPLPTLTRISSSWRWPPWCTQGWWLRSRTVLTNASSCSPVLATGSAPVSPVLPMGQRESWWQVGRTLQSWTAHQSARSLAERRTACAKLNKALCLPRRGKKEKNSSFACVIEMALRDLMSLWECSLDLFFLPVCDHCWWRYQAAPKWALRAAKVLLLNSAVCLLWAFCRYQSKPFGLRFPSVSLAWYKLASFCFSPSFPALCCLFALCSCSRELWTKCSLCFWC